MPRQNAHGVHPGRAEAWTPTSLRHLDSSSRPGRRTTAHWTAWTRPLARGNVSRDDHDDVRHGPSTPVKRTISAEPRMRHEHARRPRQDASHHRRRRRYGVRRSRRPPLEAAASRRFLIHSNVAAHIADDRRRSDELADPLPPPVSPSLVVDDDASRPFTLQALFTFVLSKYFLIYDLLMEPVNTKFYQLGNGGSLIFEHDLNALSDHLGRPHPEFHGSQIANQPGGELQWIITADLRGKMEPPTSERILFSFMESNWLDGLARALQEGLARLCGMSGEALKDPRFSHLARRNSAGEPMDMPSHPELKHHVEHLDFMLYHTQQDLDHSREYANQTHARIIEQGDCIKMLANDRRTLRQQRAKRDATITRLRAKIAALEATVKAQEEQMKKMEEDGEDIQGGSNYLSDDNDFEEDENTEGEDYDFLDDEDDDHTPIDVDEDEE
ncbi:hypothetical protein QYE76_001564 [Lolium multiflorum]|uniref:Uncharacterized protein n=1 Tax=Lolium multiflorum TaxID=4521 RepID=A0AAD8RLK8_LOLMU|nr:hypothetical protein QYE76_001564 [Lolium multiflorum]